MTATRIGLGQADDERARFAQPQHVVAQRRQLDQPLQTARVQAHEGVDEGDPAILVQRHQPVGIQVHVGTRAERSRGELARAVAACGFDLRRAAPCHPPRRRPRATQRAPAGGVFDAQRRDAAGRFTRAARSQSSPPRRPHVRRCGPAVELRLRHHRRQPQQQTSGSVIRCFVTCNVMASLHGVMYSGPTATRRTLGSDTRHIHHIKADLFDACSRRWQTPP